MFVYVSQAHGCAYALDGEDLIMTPVHDDLTYDTCWDNWVEVDHMSLLGEEQSIQDHIAWVEAKLMELAERE